MDLVTFTEEFLSGKLHFLCSELYLICHIIETSPLLYLIRFLFYFLFLIYLFIYLFVYLFIHLFIYLFIYLFVCLFIYLFICLSIYLFICLFIYLFIYLNNQVLNVARKCRFFSQKTPPNMYDNV